MTKVGGGERLKRQRSLEGSSFRADAVTSKQDQDRQKNELVKEEYRCVIIVLLLWALLLPGRTLQCFAPAGTLY